MITQICECEDLWVKPEVDSQGRCKNCGNFQLDPINFLELIRRRPITDSLKDLIDQALFLFRNKVYPDDVRWEFLEESTCHVGSVHLKTGSYFEGLVRLVIDSHIRNKKDSLLQAYNIFGILK